MTELLSSWRDTSTKQAIVQFVEMVTDESQPTFVPPSERIATFDNDGTLWCEKPMYIQFDFLVRKLASRAEAEPALRARQPWQAAWEGDFAWLGGAITKHYQGDDRDLHLLLGGIVAESHNRPVVDVEAEARRFIEHESHPKLNRRYRDCIYQPMVDLLRYLEANGFVNYIVSGGGRDFMRGFSGGLYGIPRERVIGSTVAYQFAEDEQGCQIVQQAKLDVIDDGPGKPIQIWNVAGRRPILAAGNSNGDIQMLKFTEQTDRPFLNLLVYHDDPEREYAYTEGSELALQLAAERNWRVVSMKDDWAAVFSA